MNIQDRPADAEHMRRVREEFGHTRDEFAEWLGMKGKDRARNVRRWEGGDYAIPSWVIQKLLFKSRQIL